MLEEQENSSSSAKKRPKKKFLYLDRFEDYESVVGKRLLRMENSVRVIHISLIIIGIAAVCFALWYALK